MTRPDVAGVRAKRREALQRFIDHAWGRQNKTAIFTIPADPERDADIILSEALNELERLEDAALAPGDAGEVERVARAIFKLHWTGDWPPDDGTLRAQYRQEAKAAIKALRGEP